MFENKVVCAVTRKALMVMISIQKLKELTGIASIVDIVTKKKLALFLDIKRRDQSIAKICLEYLVEAQRKPGRPRRRWKDDIKRSVKKNETSQNHKKQGDSIITNNWVRIKRSSSKF